MQSKTEIGKLLNERVLGQEEVIKEVTKHLEIAVHAHKASNKPLASFLLLGTTGVGKTELSKAVAEILCQKRILRFDMSEFQTEEAANVFLGKSSERQGRFEMGFDRLVPLSKTGGRFPTKRFCHLWRATRGSIRFFDKQASTTSRR